MDNTEIQLYFEDNKFIAQRLAGNIVFEMFDEELNDGINKGFLVTNDNKEIWRYNGGHYTPDGEKHIRDRVQHILRKKCKNQTQKRIFWRAFEKF